MADNRTFWEQKKAGLRKRFRLFTSPFRALPDFIIIGVQKGGTSSLYYYLSQHPQVKVSAKKEIHFFNLWFDKGLRWYKHFFPFRKKGILTGEATPAYLMHPKAAQRIKATCPNAKLIVLFREPLQRAYSNFKMNKRQGLEEAEDFATALERELQRHGNDERRKENNPDYYSKAIHNFSYIGRSKYFSQLQPWLQRFPKEQLLYIKSEDFFSDPNSTLSTVYEYLGLETIYPEDLSPQFAGNYKALSEVNEKRYKQLFTTENNQLKEVTGISWSE
ncbi:MAG: sulfotransferase domain-containing protein [Saprospiraceae bacterium]|nr:sulfotransferase domain-containing protein [Saprospiraceae bacterium]